MAAVATFVDVMTSLSPLVWPTTERILRIAFAGNMEWGDVNEASIKHVAILWDK